MLNLTPHEVTLIRRDGSEIRIPPHLKGGLRLPMAHRADGTAYDGVPVAEQGFPHPSAVEAMNRKIAGYVVGSNGTYVESVLVPIMLLRFVDRDLRSQVYAPDTGPESVRRGISGRVTGVRRLIRATRVE